MTNYLIRGVTPELGHAVDVWAKVEGKSRNVLILELLEQAINARKKEWEEAAQADGPYVRNYLPVTINRPMACAECGTVLESGTETYVEAWTDQRRGAIVCVACL